MQAINEGIDDKLFAHIVNSIHTTPFYMMLGLRVQCLGMGKAVYAISTEERHCNAIELIHGGVYMSMGDSAMGNAVRSLGLNGVTIDSSAHILASAKKGETIFSEGRVIKAGRSVIFTEADVRTDNQLLCTMKGAFFVKSKIEL